MLNVMHDPLSSYLGKSAADKKAGGKQTWIARRPYLRATQTRVGGLESSIVVLHKKRVMAAAVGGESQNNVRTESPAPSSCGLLGSTASCIPGKKELGDCPWRCWRQPDGLVEVRGFGQYGRLPGNSPAHATGRAGTWRRKGVGSGACWTIQTLSSIRAPVSIHGPLDRDWGRQNMPWRLVLSVAFLRFGLDLRGLKQGGDGLEAQGGVGSFSLRWPAPHGNAGRQSEGGEKMPLARGWNVCKFRSSRRLRMDRASKDSGVWHEFVN